MQIDNHDENAPDNVDDDRDDDDQSRLRRRIRRARDEFNRYQLKGGFAPAITEIILTCCTGGLLGGIGVFMAGKGAGSLVLSLTCALIYFFLSLLSCAILFLPLLPIWCLGAFVKLVVDVVKAST